jgi:cytochrome c oxidase subunit 2
MGSLQMLVLSVFLAASALIVLVFLLVYRSSKSAGELARANRKRALLFLTLLVISLMVIGTTLPKSPYFLYRQEKPRTAVFVVAKQFVFGLSFAPIRNDEDFAAALHNPPTLPADEVVEFRVTSWDVNHGFGLFDPGGRLIAQVQAMPGYMNRLRWKFDRPGEYHILCSEYCGAGHPVMRTVLRVGEAAP